jgi:hypothetical protein
MNRKLRDTYIALTSSGLLLAVALLAGSPQPLAPADGATRHAVLEGVADGASAVDLRQDAPRRRLGGHHRLAMPYFSFAQGARAHGG